MLDGLPDEAFPEVLELLANAWSFNVPSSQKIELPQRRVLKGKVTKRYERLAYSLGEQE